MSAALAAVEARRATLRAVQALRHELEGVRRIRVVAAGKAAVGMARAADEALGERLVAGMLTAAVGPVARQMTPGRASSAAELDARWIAFPASHPVPSTASEAAGRAALTLAGEVTDGSDRLLVCLSGGASAMLAVPAEGLTLEDKQIATTLLLRSGGDIGELNVVRKHLSAIKGGQLAARSARTITLAISDVCSPVEDDPSVIGSGPTMGDPSSFADAIRVIEVHGLRNDMPAAVMAHLDAGIRGEVSGPVAPSDKRLARSAFWIIASRHDAMQAAADTARRMGYHVRVRATPVVGPAREAADIVIGEARDLERPACVIASGETTVHVKGTGQGGRNQELAVSALDRLARLAPSALASIGTDGVDGPTDAAGAMVDSAMWSDLGADANAIVGRVLDDNDSYPLLERLDALVRTGATGTNVGDVQILLIE